MTGCLNGLCKAHRVMTHVFWLGYTGFMSALGGGTRWRHTGWMYEQAQH